MSASFVWALLQFPSVCGTTVSFAAVSFPSLTAVSVSSWFPTTVPFAAISCPSFAAVSYPSWFPITVSCTAVSFHPRVPSLQFCSFLHGFLRYSFIVSLQFCRFLHGFLRYSFTVSLQFCSFLHGFLRYSVTCFTGSFVVSFATVSFATVPFVVLQFPSFLVYFAAVSFVALQLPSSASAKGLSLTSAVAVTVCTVASLVYCGAVCSPIAMLATTAFCLVQLWYASRCAASFAVSSVAASWWVAALATVLWSASVLAAQWLADSSVTLWSAALYAVPSSEVFGLGRHWSSLLSSSSGSSYLFTTVFQGSHNRTGRGCTNLTIPRASSIRIP